MQRSPPGPPLGESLPPTPSREAELLCLKANGRTSREIADLVVFSVSTVKNHVKHIVAQLGLADRTQAAVRAVELGLIEQEGR